MQIIVDYRERQLYSALLSLTQNCDDVQVKSKNLDVADIIIGDCSERQILIERKTLDDLSSSIRDGRYKDQADRLSKASEMKERIFYLIEGDTKGYQAKNSKHTLPIGTLISAMFTLSTVYKFSLYRTNDVAESAHWIYCIARKFGKTSGCVPPAVPGPFLKKSSTVNKGNIETLMLAQIPGISVKSAQAILEQSGGLRSLLALIESEPEKLGTIVVMCSNGKSRRLSKTGVQNIMALLA